VNARPLAPALVTIALGAGCGSTGPSDAVAPVGSVPDVVEADLFFQMGP
jgi:hypothetical protein